MKQAKWVLSTLTLKPCSLDLIVFEKAQIIPLKPHIMIYIQLVGKMK